jgi:hypothetical protein
MRADYQRQWRARRRASRRQICAYCNDVFVPSRSDQVFCGPACAQREHRRRKATGEPAAKRRQPQPPFLEATEPLAESQHERAKQRADFLASLIG